VTLDHRAHGAIEDEQALLQKGGKFGGTVGLNHDHLGKTECTGDAAKTNGATNRQVCERR
jgi:hypothetical protein